MKKQIQETTIAGDSKAFAADDRLPTEAQVSDLDLTDEELDGIKGGPSSNPGSEDGGGGRMGGDWILNHNEVLVSDE